jgi:hypothetical protein
METQRYDFVIQQGARWFLNLEYEIDGEPVNIESYQVRMQIRKSYDLPFIAELTTENGRIVVSDVNVIDLELDAAATAELVAGRYLYDIELVNAGSVERILLGVATVSAEVTK